MNIEVQQIAPRKENGEVVGVQVYFNGRLGDQTITLNGYVPLSQEEFDNMIDFEAIGNVVKQKVIDRIMNGESPAE